MVRPLDLSEWWRNGLVFVALLFSVSANVKAQTVQPAQAVPPTTRPGVTRLTNRQQRNLIRHNEAGAIRTLFTLLSAEATYQATVGSGDFGTIEQLGKEKLIDFVLADGHRFGYLFRARLEKFSSKFPASFKIVAVPRTYGRTGRRSFYLDESGVIRYLDKKGAEANPEDNMLVIDP